MSTAPVVPAVTEVRYEFQPTDDLGRPIGGKQVIIYDGTPGDLGAKLAHQNTLLIRKLREEGRKRRLGIDDDNIAADSERMAEVPQFKERELTAQERFELSQKLNDPEHVNEARDILFESTLGVSPAKLREILSETQLAGLQRRAADNFITFGQAAVSQGYFDCPENREIIADWVFKKELAPSATNFMQAFSTLKSAGLLIEAPVQQQVTPAPSSTPVDLALDPEASSQPPAAPVTRIGDTVQPPTTRQSQLPSGLNDRVSSASGAAPAIASGATRQDGTTLSLKEINRMGSTELAQRMKDPAFVQLVQKLETEDKARKAALGLQKF